jgi:uncharacterized membrane protein YhaH (DUF805 family)
MNVSAIRGAFWWWALAAAGVAAGYGAYLAAMFALIPFLLYSALGAAPFVALALAGAVYACTRSRPCAAPLWLQDRRNAFWAGVVTVLVLCCAFTVIEMPQTIPFWPT